MHRLILSLTSLKNYLFVYFVFMFTVLSAYTMYMQVPIVWKNSNPTMYNQTRYNVSKTFIVSTCLSIYLLVLPQAYYLPLTDFKVDIDPIPLLCSTLVWPCILNHRFNPPLLKAWRTKWLNISVFMLISGSIQTK